MKPGLVSIAMATYNGAKYIRKQLDSIYAQTYKNIEVVVTDDCSKDDTAAILEEYKKKRGLRYVVNEKNLGFVRNFEKAMSLCVGEYIALSDQDDVWEPNKIERLIEAVAGKSLVCSDASLIDDEDAMYHSSFIAYAGSSIPDDSIKKDYLLFGNFVTGCTTLFRSELLKTALPIPEGETFHDWWLAIVASRRKGIAFVNEPLVRYRQHGLNSAGAWKKLSASDKVKRFFSNFGKNKKADGSFKFADMQSRRLAAIRVSPVFDDADRAILDDALIYYGDAIHSRIHWKSYRIAKKYADILFFNVGKKRLGLRLLKKLFYL